MEGVSTAKIVLFHLCSTELRRYENCIFFLPVNILTGVARRLLGPHDTLPCVLILLFACAHIHMCTIFVYPCGFIINELMCIHRLATLNTSQILNKLKLHQLPSAVDLQW